MLLGATTLYGPAGSGRPARAQDSCTDSSRIWSKQVQRAAQAAQKQARRSCWSSSAEAARRGTQPEAQAPSAKMPFLPRRRTLPPPDEADEAWALGLEEGTGVQTAVGQPVPQPYAQDDTAGDTAGLSPNRKGHATLAYRFRV